MTLIFNEQAQVVVWIDQQNAGASVWSFSPTTGRHLEESFAENVKISLLRTSNTSMHFVVVVTAEDSAVSGEFRLSLRSANNPGVERGSIRVIGQEIESVVNAREWQGTSLVHPFVTPVGAAVALILDGQDPPRVEDLDWYMGAYDAEYQSAIEAILVPAKNEIAFAIQRSKVLVVCDLETLETKRRLPLPGNYNGAHIVDTISGNRLIATNYDTVAVVECDSWTLSHSRCLQFEIGSKGAFIGTPHLTENGEVLTVPRPLSRDVVILNARTLETISTTTFDGEPAEAVRLDNGSIFAILRDVDSIEIEIEMEK